MYEVPKLNRIGEATEVILGYDGSGLDLDGTDIAPPFEFAAEENLEDGL